MEKDFLYELIIIFYVNKRPDDIIIKYLVNMKKINRFRNVLEKLPEEDIKSLVLLFF